MHAHELFGQEFGKEQRCTLQGGVEDSTVRMPTIPILTHAVASSDAARSFSSVGLLTQTSAWLMTQ